MTREELRQRAKSEDIRNHYTFKKSKGHNMYCCPICHSGEGDHRTGALQINEDGTRITCHKEHCFSSQGEDTLGALKILLGTDENGVFEYMKLLKDDTAARPAQAVDVALAQKRKAQAAEEKTEESADYSTFFLQAHADLSGTNYPWRRGLTQKTLDRFNVGYVESWRHPNASASVPTSPRLIIPTSSSSYLARDVREIVPEAAKPYTKQKCGKQHIFNAEALRSNEPVYIVEGEIDAMSLYEVGCEAVALGSISHADKLLSELEEAVRADQRVREGLCILLALDNERDPATAASVNMAAEKIENGCKERGIDVRRVNPHQGYKDPNEALMADRKGFTEKAVSIAEGIKAPHSVAEYLRSGFAADIQSFQNGARYRTGFDNLDKEIGHVYPGLYVLGAISSLGKTTFSLQVADQIAEQGYDVLFFSLEQSRFELVSKSLSRDMAQHDMHTAQTALAIRAQFGEREDTDDAILAAVERRIRAAGHHMNIIEGDMNTTLQTIEHEVRQHVQRTGRHPVVFIDYLQILKNSEAEAGATLREVTDRNVTELKILSRELDVPVFAISSINRSNYLTPIDFESFKESGGIEYSADVVWGLQLRALNEDIFERDSGVKQKRDRIREAKAAVPREIELVCLKNRFGRTGFSCFFEYDPRFDLYTGVKGKEEQPKPKRKML